MKLFDNTLYLAGGGNRNDDTGEIRANGTVWSFTPESGFERIAEIEQPSESLLAVALFKQDNSLLIVPQMDIHDAITDKYVVDVTTGAVSKQDIYIAGWSDPFGLATGYCIVDDGREALPGLYRDGNCKPLASYNSHSIGYFDYKFTLAGQNDRLFIGGLSGIRTARINGDGSLSNEDFKWIGRPVTGIQIFGNRLYAASPDKVRIYTITDGVLTYAGSINADYPRNIRIVDSKLFVADGRAVSVWNINGNTPVFEREIETAYRVKDFEVVNGHLFVYEEESYWYWFWLRKHTKFEIMEPGEEEGDEVVVYSNGVSCEDSEMMQDDNFVYLGCQSSNYRIHFEYPFVSEPINGKKRYFRDNYYYQGKVYQTFSGAVHVSE
jgi:hypothetical protein